jgi:hypothetical protein
MISHDPLVDEQHQINGQDPSDAREVYDADGKRIVSALEAQMRGLDREPAKPPSPELVAMREAAAAHVDGDKFEREAAESDAEFAARIHATAEQTADAIAKSDDPTGASFVASEWADEGSELREEIVAASKDRDEPPWQEGDPTGSTPDEPEAVVIAPARPKQKPLESNASYARRLGSQR